MCVDEPPPLPDPDNMAAIALIGDQKIQIRELLRAVAQISRYLMWCAEETEE